MEKYKLIRILKSLTPVEFDNFGYYIYSPFFNESDKLIKLYGYLKKYYPEFKSGDITKKNMFELMYPGEKYNDKKLRNRLSLMIRLAKGYLTYLEFQGSSFFKKFFWLKQLRTKDMGNLFDKEMELTSDFVENAKYKDEDYYLRKFMLESLKRRYDEGKTQVGKSKLLFENLVIENDNLIKFTIINLFKNYLKLRNAEGLIVFEHQFRLYEELSNYIEKEERYFKEIPAIRIFHEFLKLNDKNKNEKSYQELKELLYNNVNEFERDDLKNLFFELYNYCKDKQSKGEKYFGEEVFELMKEMLSKELYLESDGHIHPHNYINFAASAIRINELNWAEGFIKDYKNSVNPEFRENAFNYNMAVLNYARGKRDITCKDNFYVLSLQHLELVKKEDFYYYLRIHNLMLMIYYELKDFEPARCIIDSYQQRLHKNPDVPEQLRERLINFLKFTRKLIVKAENSERASLSSLTKELKAANNIEYKGWLRERIEELERQT